MTIRGNAALPTTGASEQPCISRPPARGGCLRGTSPRSRPAHRASRAHRQADSGGIDPGRQGRVMRRTESGENSSSCSGAVAGIWKPVARRRCRGSTETGERCQRPIFRKALRASRGIWHHTEFACSLPRHQACPPPVLMGFRSGVWLLGHVNRFMRMKRFIFSSRHHCACSVGCDHRTPARQCAYNAPAGRPDSRGIGNGVGKVRAPQGTVPGNAGGAATEVQQRQTLARVQEARGG